MFELRPSDTREEEAVPEGAATGRPREWERSRSALRLQARLEPSGLGWTVRLPVRAEQVTIDKETVVVETVQVRSVPVEEVVELGDTIRRERLRVEAEGELEARTAQDWESERRGRASS